MALTWSALHAQLLRSSRRVSFLQAFRSFRERNPELADFPSPPSLLEFIHRPDRDLAEKNCVLRALVVEAQRDGSSADAAKTLVLLALCPGLDAIHGRLRRFFRADPDRLVAELSGRVSAQIATLRLDRVNRIAATILRNVERDIRRMLGREWQDSAAGLVDVEDVPVEAAADPGALLPWLRAAIPRDAELVIAVAVLGLSQKEAAHALGISHDVARKRYQRALETLRAVFSDGDVPKSSRRRRFPFDDNRSKGGADMASPGEPEFQQVPGLFRLWDLQFVLNKTDDFQVHYAHQTEDGTPLFAVYRREEAAEVVQRPGRINRMARGPNSCRST